MSRFLFISLFLLLQSLVAQDTLSLRGSWEFEADKSDQGLKEDWSQKKFTQKINLPGITDEIGIGETEYQKGALSRKHLYRGAAWYSKEITIPKSWKDKNIELSLERVYWLSKLWVDGKPLGQQDSLHTPHTYMLGKLTPGKHRITLLIDNREQVKLLGSSWGHSMGNQTQIQWNGVLGHLELRVLEPQRLDKVRTLTDHKGLLDAECTFTNESPEERKGKVEITIRNPYKKIYSKTYPVTLPSGSSTQVFSDTISRIKPWDEFAPNLYTFSATFIPDKNPATTPSVRSKPTEKKHTIGFRSLKTEGDYIVLNDIPRFMRGNLDCAVFPLTGYPPMDKDSWRRILKTYKDHGLNHIRFHSWTPPQAAFEVADELGLYVLSEIFWRDGWMGEGLDIDAAEKFLKPELRRIADTYGNHTSLLMLAMGNELGGFDLKKMDPWIAEVKKHDPRHLYATSVRRSASIHADIDYMGNLGAGYPLSYIQRGELNTKRNFAPWYGKKNWYLKDQPHLPGIQHEIGQWVFYPDWNELKKYTGLLRPTAMEEAKKLAQENGVLAQNHEFTRASGKTAMMLYKENIESLLRTPSCGGFQLLGIQDFSGQGIALIGWLDAFYDSKGIVTPREFRTYCNDTVLLMETDKFTLTNHENLSVDLKVLRFASSDLKDSTLTWRLMRPGHRVFASGQLSPLNIPNTKLSDLGSFTVPLSGITEATQLTLEVALKGTDIKNSWNFWVFPPAERIEAPQGITVTTSLKEAQAALSEKKKVLLLAHKLGEQNNMYYAQWLPAFWVGNAAATNGTLVRNSHPALEGFPTEDFADYQWYDLCKNSRGFEMKGLPNHFRPIVQPINDFHFNKKLGSIFELKSPEGGKLLVCGYDLESQPDKRPVATALKKSLLTYMSSRKFNPKTKYPEGWLEKAILDPDAPFAAPESFKEAVLYVKAGGHKTLPIGTYHKWEEKMDGVTPYDATKYGYAVTCDLVWKRTADYSLWQGKKIHIDFKIPFDFTGNIAITFDSYDDENRTGTILHNGKTVEIGKLPKPQPGGGGGTKTILLPLKSGDTLLGKYGIDIECTGGANLLITEIALVPEKK